MVHLLDLPNCVMIYLLSYLDSTSLYLLSRTCERLEDIIKNCKILWRNIDARRTPNNEKKTNFCSQLVHEDTNSFLIRAENKLCTIVPDEFFTKIANFNNLRVLALENQTIVGSRYSITLFPRWLHELSLKNSIIQNNREFFRNSDHHVNELRVLILDECHWLHSSSFMSISKYENLEILSVYKCRNIDNSIPYLSLSGKFGFRNLKIFDARLSTLGNTLLRSLHKSDSILSIYLQNEDISYKLDYFKRKLDILNGAKTCEFYTEDDEFTINDNDKKCDEINDPEANYEHPWSLDDRGLLEYLSIGAVRTATPLPESLLYTDPYNACKCGYEERNKKKPPQNEDSSENEKSFTSSSSSDDDDDDDDDNDDDHDLIKKHKKLIKHLRNCLTDENHNRGLNRQSAAASAARSQSSSSRSNSNNINLHEILRNPNAPRIASNQYIVHIDNVDGNVAIIRPPQKICSDLQLGGAPQSREGRKRSLDGNNGEEAAAEEEKAKKSKTNGAVENNEPEAGPSGGVNNNNSNNNNNNNNNLRAEEINVGEIERARRIAPLIRIVNIDLIPKDVKVPLRRLSLRGYKKITNKSLGYLKDLDLELLDLTYTNCTISGINNYLVDHPYCRIVHEKFCICPPNLHF